MENMPRFAVTYGRTDFFSLQDKDDKEGLNTVFLSSAEEVKDLANNFINVIPDDLDDYKKDIKKWKGKDRLLITHQDDDTFYFSAVPIPNAPTTDASAQARTVKIVLACGTFGS